MFKWLRGGATSGLAEVAERFTGMLADSRKVFELAMSARLDGVDPVSIADELARTEERTDEAERAIRRRVVVHASTTGEDLPACLMYMSIAKDGERIGDLGKSIFDITRSVGPPPPGELHDDLASLRESVRGMITEAAEIFLHDDSDAAHRFIVAARELQQWCGQRIDAALQDDATVPQPAASALTYRHLSRILANLLNIVSAVVMPLDQLDYPSPP